ncbi:MAG: iron-containing alcohol dehydrogenase [Lentisphaerae bacterium]|nr:iron-containing alcohol dehydrogenase [Lentisphaerota bacterium]
MATIPSPLILPPRTILKRDGALQLLLECAHFGRRGMLVHGRSLDQSGKLDAIMKCRTDAEVITYCHSGGEPTLRQLQELLDVARSQQVAWIAGVGGGSVLDVAKACAGLLYAPEDLESYHDGAAIPESMIPFIAVPTTAGTGSESTIVSVLTNEKRGVKKSIRHPSFMARVVILDPELLSGCPSDVIANSGLDAFTQGIEAYVSNQATWFSDVIALKAVELVGTSLVAVYKGDNSKQSDLLIGSYLAGAALTNARLGLVHGLAHPLGIRYRQPHGRTCAICLPYIMRFNRETISWKYNQMCNVIGDDLEESIARMTSCFGIRSPFEGQALSDIDSIIEETLESGSTAANPRNVEAADVRAILGQLFSQKSDSM